VSELRDALFSTEVALADANRKLSSFKADKEGGSAIAGVLRLVRVVRLVCVIRVNPLVIAVKT